MRKGIRILYFITVVTSALVGLWHFFVPWMFQWYDYLPTQYENIKRAVSLCFETTPLNADRSKLISS